MTTLAVLLCIGQAPLLIPAGAGQAFANTTPSADFDGDGIVGISDFLLFVEKFGSRQGDEKYDAKYDLDGNGEIAIPDFLVFVDNFGKEVPPRSQRDVLIAWSYPVLMESLGLRF